MQKVRTATLDRASGPSRVRPFRGGALLLGLLSLWSATAAGALTCLEENLDSLHAVKGHGVAAVDRGRQVRVQGVVTGDFRGRERLNGFYLQSREAAVDGLPTGLFVYTPSIEAHDKRVKPGAEVVIAARIEDFRGQRQLTKIEYLRVCGEPGLPMAIPLPFPPKKRSLLRRYEGLYVRLPPSMTVTGNDNLALFGSLDLAIGGRLFRPANAPGIHSETNERRRLILDDASYRRNPCPPPYLNSSATRRVGSQPEALGGILAWAFDDWRLHPLVPEAVNFIEANPRPMPLPKAGLRVVGFNVENYFLTLGERGAATAADLYIQRRRLQAVVAGLNPDLLGLVEVENRPEAVADLADRLGQGLISEASYQHFVMEEPLGTDKIRVALLWRPARVELLGGPFIDRNPVHYRPPVAGHFRLRGSGPGQIVAVIHHKSKTHCPEVGDIDRGQGCWNELRTAQSRALAAFLHDLAQERGTDEVLIVGDINSYAEEDPVQVLRAAGLIDLVAKHLPREVRYSYVYRGESGYLDTALASPALVPAVAQIHFWHVNADEPSFLRLCDGFTESSGPWRSSDHDPIVVDLSYP